MANGFDLGSAYGSIIIDASGVRAGVQEAQNALAAGVQQMGQSLESLGRSIQNVGSQFTQLSAPLLGLGAFGIKASIDFESAFAGVRKTVDATEEEFALLQQRIETMATSPDSMTSSLENADIQLARIMELAGQLGISGVDNLTSFTETISLLGMTTNIIGEEAALSLAQFANITQMPIDKISNLGSVIVDLGNNMATTERDIVNMAQRIAGAGNIAGMSQAEIMALAAALSSVGIEAEAGGTAISRVMIEMNTAVAEGGKKMEDFARVAGMSASDFAAQWRTNPAQALNAFINGLRRMNGEGQNVTATLEELSFGEIRVRDALLRLSTGEDLMSQALGIANEAWTENNALNKEAAQRALTTESGINRLKNNLTAMGKDVGELLLPTINNLVDQLIGVIKHIREWADANPELFQQLVQLGAVIASIGPVLLVVGKTIALVGGLITALASPIGLLIAAVAVLAAAWHNNFLNIQGITERFTNTLRGFIDGFRIGMREGTSLLTAFTIGIHRGFGLEAGARVLEFIQYIRDLRDAIGRLFVNTGAGEFFASLDFSKIFEVARTLLSLTTPLGQILAVLKAFGVDVMGTLFEGLKKLPDMINVMADGGGIFDALRVGFGDTAFLDGLEQAFNGIIEFIQTSVMPVLQQIVDWFTTTGLPIAIDFVQNTAAPFLQSAFEQVIGFISSTVIPGLQQLADWFIADALPLIVEFVQSVVIPGVERFIKILQDIWNIAAPFLQRLFNWFVNDALPVIVGFIRETVIPGIQRFMDILMGFWDSIQPGLNAFFLWVTESALPLVVDFFQNVLQPVIDILIDVLATIWETVQPALSALFNWFMTDGLPFITNVIQGAMDNFIKPLINLLKGIWEAVKPAFTDFKNNLLSWFYWIRDNVFRPLMDTVQKAIDFVKDLLAKLGLVQQQSATALNQNVAQNFPNLPQMPGHAAGLAYVPYDNYVARLHEGEAVLSRSEAQTYRDGGGITIQSVVIHAGSYNEGQAAADGFSDRLRELRRARG